MNFSVMLKTLHLFICSSVLFQGCKTFDYKLITAVRHGIEKNLEYIDLNYKDMNEDCWFGVVLSSAIIKDAYQDGTQVMDNSSQKLLITSLFALEKGISSIHTGRYWIIKYVLDPRIWQRNIKYKYNALDPYSNIPNFRSLENVYRYQNFSDDYPNSDICMEDVVNLTLAYTPVRCNINPDCWKKYYEYSRFSSGYILTHKLLLLQLARARKCLILTEEYEAKTSELCSLIFKEVISADYFDVLDDVFDLFLEEVLLCGLEGYTEFFKTKWLIYILKSQKQSGCFPAFLEDSLKTRIKRNTNIFPDGCADHTTGLGGAVLSLYYNFIIKGNIVAVD